MGPGDISGGSPLLTSRCGTNSPFPPSRHCDVDCWAPGVAGVSLIWPSHLLQSTIRGQAGPVPLETPLAWFRLLQNAPLKTSGPM